MVMRAQSGWEQLANLPRLTRRGATTATKSCKVCRRPADFFDIVDFNKCASGYPFGPSGVTVTWHRCAACGFLFTPFFDEWSSAEFAKYVYNDDYVLVDPDYIVARPRIMAKQVAALLVDAGDLRILDFGSGSGRFAGHMAQAGRPNVASFDPFSQPHKPDGRFDVITCFEVLEHSADPLAMIDEILTFAVDNCCIILGQATQPPDIERIRANWWYCAPRNGHCSTFSSATLSVLAAQRGLVFHRSTNPHAFRRGENSIINMIARRVGNPFLGLSLMAPAKIEVTGWHGPERVGDLSVRWTAQSQIVWEIDIPTGEGCDLQIRIPYLMEARKGFAEGSQIEVNGVAARVTHQAGAIIAECDGLSAGRARIVLRTPELREPVAPDPRRLGLMIEI